jgi:hypothetical protein
MLRLRFSDGIRYFDWLKEINARKNVPVNGSSRVVPVDRTPFQVTGIGAEFLVGDGCKADILTLICSMSRARNSTWLGDFRCKPEFR